MKHIAATGEVFEMHQDLIDVTSMSRVDPSWRFVDPAGHEHRWYANGQPATTYSPSQHYDLPTLIVVHDGLGYYEDGEEYELSHYECPQCGAHVRPGTCADSTTQYIGGLCHCRINGEFVSEDEFKRRFEEARRA